MVKSSTTVPVHLAGSDAMSSPHLDYLPHQPCLYNGIVDNAPYSSVYGDMAAAPTSSPMFQSPPPCSALHQGRTAPLPPYFTTPPPNHVHHSLPPPKIPSDVITSVMPTFGGKQTSAHFKPLNNGAHVPSGNVGLPAVSRDNNVSFPHYHPSMQFMRGPSARDQPSSKVCNLLKPVRWFSSVNFASYLFF